MTALSELDLKRQQRLVLLWSAASFVLCGLVLSAACLILPDFYRFPEGLAERIAFALQADVFIFLWVLIAARQVSGGRYRSAADNRGSAFGPPSARLAIPVSFLQNTLEQAVMAVGAHMALASLADARGLALIVGSVVLFGIGRVAFRVGYRHGAGGRAFGMATTAIPTVVAYVWSVWLIVANMLPG